MTEPNDEGRERALPYTIADQERAIDWLGGYKHPGVPALAREFAAVRAAERERCAAMAERARSVRDGEPCPGGCGRFCHSHDIDCVCGMKFYEHRTGRELAAAIREGK